MTIEPRVLGIPGQDNAVYMRIDSGQAIYNLLFDCGEGCIYPLGRSVLQEIDHLFLSHGHMDHICGFDGLFRHLYSRYRPLHIWGPRGTIDIMHCRFRGFTWNLVSGSPGEIVVHEITRERIASAFFLCREAFSTLHPLPEKPFESLILSEKDYEVRCAVLNHGIDCLGYAVVEPDRLNINTEILSREGFVPGRWCAELKRTDLSPDTLMETGKGSYPLSRLREMLLEKKKGNKVGYVTDISLTEDNRTKVLSLADQADELILECSYDDTEKELAEANFHLTVSQSAQTALDAHVGRLTLFHFSDRYSREHMGQMHKKACVIFPNTFLPGHWIIG